MTIDGETIQYLYDGLGNRIARIRGGIQTRYILDLNGPMSQALAETDSIGDVINYYIYGHGLISRITADEQRYCYHFDSRGSTIAVSDHSENIVNKYAYDEFGEVLAENETIPNPFKYIGKYGVMDEGNGLLFMRARYYDVSIGRFLSKDPLRGELVDPGTLNRYVYAMGNPLMGIDPEGMEPKWQQKLKKVVQRAVNPLGKVFGYTGGKIVGGLMGESYGRTTEYTISVFSDPAKAVLITQEEKQKGEAALQKTVSDLMSPDKNRQSKFYKWLMKKSENISTKIEEYFPSKILERHGIKPVINVP